MGDQEFSIGVDIGGTNTRIGWVDSRGQVLSTGHLNTRDYSTPDSFLAAILAEVDALIKQWGKDGLKGLGVGAPNANFYNGCIESAANLPWKGRIPVRDFFSRATGLPVVVTNDANAAALGEMVYGAARGKQNFVMITLGTGVGSGIVANGKLLYGYNGIAGELGHVIAVRGGRPCGCGRNGCLETYTSATGLITTAIMFLQQEKYYQDVPPGYLQGYWKSRQELTGKMIYDAAEAGDPLAKKIFDFTGEVLGQAMADAAAILAPEQFVLFGGLTAAGHWIYDPIRQAFEAAVLAAHKGRIDIVFSKLPDNEAAILGAAALIASGTGNL